MCKVELLGTDNPGYIVGHWVRGNMGTSPWKQMFEKNIQLVT